MPFFRVKAGKSTPYRQPLQLYEKFYQWRTGSNFGGWQNVRAIDNQAAANISARMSCGGVQTCYNY